MGDDLIEPHYVVSLEEVCWGCALVAITLAVHGFGMLAVLGVNQKLKNWSESRTSLVSGLFPVILAGWMIMLVHLSEVLVWAAFFLWKDAFPNASVAYYFAVPRQMIFKEPADASPLRAPWLVTAVVSVATVAIVVLFIWHRLVASRTISDPGVTGRRWL